MVEQSTFVLWLSGFNEASHLFVDSSQKQLHIKILLSFISILLGTHKKMEKLLMEHINVHIMEHINVLH